jgi:hypothetical protein
MNYDERDVPRDLPYGKPILISFSSILYGQPYLCKEV